ncbi:MAG TPA: hypothetical protein P5150_05495 [Candidatus Ratteibacteria bacterium]|nr:hypothetical protein [Candidatus Ratteibacteria bacterium]
MRGEIKGEIRALRGEIIGLRDKVDSITNIEKVKERMDRIEKKVGII